MKRLVKRLVKLDSRNQIFRIFGAVEYHRPNPKVQKNRVLTERESQPSLYPRVFVVMT